MIAVNGIPMVLALVHCIVSSGVVRIEVDALSQCRNISSDGSRLGSTPTRGEMIAGLVAPTGVLAVSEPGQVAQAAAQTPAGTGCVLCRDHVPGPATPVPLFRGHEHAPGTTTAISMPTPCAHRH
ncbi:MAG TPA: hypothetical protein VLZ55_00430 [Rhodanobacter sp.]|nr:hypothetical protein [Rhodanobacter sp.]